MPARFSTVPWILAIVGALLPLGGCKTWQPSTVSPQRLIGEEDPSSIRVTTADGSIVTLDHPRVVNDSIVSLDGSGQETSFDRPRRGVLSTEVRSVEVARFSPGRSLGLASALIALGVVWTSTLGDSSGGSTEVPEPLPKTPALSLLEFRFVLGGGRQ